MITSPVSFTRSQFHASTTNVSPIIQYKSNNNSNNHTEHTIHAYPGNMDDSSVKTNHLSLNRTCDRNRFYALHIGRQDFPAVQPIRAMRVGCRDLKDQSFPTKSRAGLSNQLHSGGLFPSAGLSRVCCREAFTNAPRKIINPIRLHHWNPASRAFTV